MARSSWLALVAMLFLASSATAQVRERHPGDRPGLAVAGGFGGPFAGLGAHVAYYASVGEGVFVTPFLGYGIAGTDVHGLHLGPAAGAMLMLGRESHWIVSSSYGQLGVMRRLESEPFGVNLGTLLSGETSTVIYGATLEAGYEWMFDRRRPLPPDARRAMDPEPASRHPLLPHLRHRRRLEVLA